MSESRSEDEWQEADVSSTSEETWCFIEQLPPEVMEIIFAHVPHPVKLRVVCKRWCAILSRDHQTLCFEGTIPHDQLENCTFEKFGLKLRGNMDINKVPQSVWEKIGFRVHSVEFDSFIFRDCLGLKNLIIHHFQNLRTLQVVFEENASLSLSFSRETRIVYRLGGIEESALSGIITSRQSKSILLLQRIIPRFCDLQHLDLEYLPNDDRTLQNIFKYMINLKSLAVRVTLLNTNAGITGRRCECVTEHKVNCLTASDGYSISRLKYLEKFIFTGFRDSMMNDSAILDDFIFPRLYYFRIDFRILRDGKLNIDLDKALPPTLGKNMPLLKKIIVCSRKPKTQKPSDWKDILSVLKDIY